MYSRKTFYKEYKIWATKNHVSRKASLDFMRVLDMSVFTVGIIFASV